MKKIGHLLSVCFKVVGIWAAVILTCPGAQAATYNWTAGTDYFTNPTAWSPEGVPGTADTADIGNGGTALLTSPSTNALAALLLGDASNSGAFSLSGGELDVTNSAANSLVVGNAANSVATFTMDNGTLTLKRNASTFFQDFLQIGYGKDSVGTFTLNNGTLTLLGGLEIGSGGQGTLNINGGTFINNGWCGLGRGGNGNNGNCSAYFNLAGGTVYLLRNPGTDSGLNGLSFAQGATNATFIMSGGTLYTPALRFGNVNQTDWETMTVSAGDIYLGGWGVVSNNNAGTHTVSINLSGGTFHSVNLGPNTGGTQGLSSILTGGTNWTWAATLPINLTNYPGAGTVTFAPEATRTFTLNSPISGPGALVVNGPGTVALGAANTHTGGTTLSQGNLQFNSGGSVLDPVLTVPSGSAIVFNGGTQNFTNSLTGAGDVLVTGASTAYTYGNLTHSGRTVVNNGTLALGTALNHSSLVLVTNTGTLAGLGPIGAPVTVASTNSPYAAHLRMGMSPLNVPGTLTINNDVTLGAGSELDIKLGTATTPGGGLNDLLVVNGNLTIDPNAFVNIIPLQQLTPGTYTIISYTGTRTGAFTNTVLGLTRYGFAFDYSTPGQVKLTVSGSPGTLVWQGATNTTWDVLGTSNWVRGAAVDVFAEGDAVEFNDSATNFNFVLSSTLYPASITFNNNSNYASSGSGSGKISGGTALIKNGTGTVTMASGLAGGNDFTGPVQLNNGIFKMNGARSLGATNGATYVAAGATLDLNGASPNDEPMVLQGAGFGGTNGAINNTGSQVNLSGGPRKVTLAGDTTINASAARWDMGVTTLGAGGGYFVGNGYTLSKIGTKDIWLHELGDTGLGDILVKEGLLGFEYTIGLGNPANTLFVYPNASLGIWQTPALSKRVAMTNATLYSNGGAGTSNVLSGTITLTGTNTFNIAGAANPVALLGAIGGPGGFQKLGTGPLYLEGANTYTGPTLLNGGSIVLRGAGTLANSALLNLAADTFIDATASGLALGNGKTLSGFGGISGTVSAGANSVLSPGAGLTAGTLTFSNSLALNGVTNIIKLSSDPDTVGEGVNDLLLVCGDLALSGVSTIKVVPTGTLNADTPYTVAQYAASGAGALSGGLANLRVVTDNPRYTFSIVNPATTYPYIQVKASGNTAPLVWKGGKAPNPNVWDHSTTNWFNADTASFDLFYNADQATFDDTAATNLVTIVGTNTASPLAMKNHAVQYTFVGGGLLGGALEMQGTGSLTLAMSNPPAFASIAANSGTLVYNIQGVGVYSNNATITDNSDNAGTIIQAGTNTLVLNRDNQTMTATLLVTNGVLQYTNGNNLGVPRWPLYATNTGSLDMNGVAADIKNIIIAGAGFNGQGALFASKNVSSANGLVNLALAGDAVIGTPGSVRMDFSANAANSPQIQGNGYKLTKVGTGTVIIYDQLQDGDTHFGDIEIKEGRLAFQLSNGGTVLLGDSSKTLTVQSNATLTFYDITSGDMNKVMVLNGGDSARNPTNSMAYFDSGGAATTTNTFSGPITLAGNNNLFGMRRALSLTGDIGGSGGFIAGTSPVGGGTQPLFLYGHNTYSGPTIISNNCQVVVGSGSSLGTSSLIQVNSGARLDVSALEALTLGAGQKLIGTGTVVGNVVVGNAAILAPDFGGTGTLTVSSNLTLQAGSTNFFKLNAGTGASDAVAGLNSVTYGGTLILSNITLSPFTAGTTFHLFTAATYNSSAFAAILPERPGAGLRWDTSRLSVDGTLSIASEAPPQVHSVTLLGDGNFQLSFSAAAGSHYTLWATDNLAQPLSQWTVLKTGTIATSPLSFDDLDATNHPQRFYLISVP